MAIKYSQTQQAYFNKGFAVHIVPQHGARALCGKIATWPDRLGRIEPAELNVCRTCRKTAARIKAEYEAVFGEVA